MNSAKRGTVVKEKMWLPVVRATVREPVIKHQEQADNLSRMTDNYRIQNLYTELIHGNTSLAKGYFYL